MRALRMDLSKLWALVDSENASAPQFCHTGMVILVGTGSVGISVISFSLTVKLRLV